MDELCDTILRYLDINPSEIFNVDERFVTNISLSKLIEGETKTFRNYEMKEIEVAIATLCDDKYIINGNGDRVPTNKNNDRFTLSSKGRRFINTSSYVLESQKFKELKEIEDQERIIRKQEIEKNNWDISKMGKTYAFAKYGFIISAIALLSSDAVFQLIQWILKSIVSKIMH